MWKRVFTPNYLPLSDLAVLVRQLMLITWRTDQRLFAANDHKTFDVLSTEFSKTGTSIRTGAL